MKKIIPGILLFVLCAGCSNNHSPALPKRFKSLKNLKIYSLNQHPDTVHLKRQQIFGNTKKVPIGRLTDVAVDSSGRVYIADGKTKTIKAYKPNGQFVTTLGRQGKGPGEFLEIRNIQIAKNELYVYDIVLQRISVFSLDSLTYDQTISIASNRNQFKKVSDAYLGHLYVRKDGTFLMGFTNGVPTQNVSDWKKVEKPAIYYLLDSKGQINSKNLFKKRVAIDVWVPPPRQVKHARPTVNMYLPFYGKLLMNLSDDNNIYTAWSENFLIKVYNQDGEYRYAFYYPYERVPLSQASSKEAEIPKYFVENMSQMELPQTWPALHSLKIDSKNRLWISTIVKNQKVYQWWVLNKKGNLLARFTWPRDKPIEIIKKGHVYTKEKNPKTGVQQIIRYKIQMQ
jgi:hypothetical protein